MLSQLQLSIDTRGRGAHDLSADVQAAVKASGISTGMCHVFMRHTSASLMISENADPAVMVDLESFMSRLVPDGDAIYTHTDEGPDDMPSHIRMALTRTSEVIPIINGRMALGTWQGIFLFEHRRAPHEREIAISVVGE